MNKWVLSTLKYLQTDIELILMQNGLSVSDKGFSSLYINILPLEKDVFPSAFYSSIELYRVGYIYAGVSPIMVSCPVWESSFISNANNDNKAKELIINRVKEFVSAYLKYKGDRMKTSGVKAVK